MNSIYHEKFIEDYNYGIENEKQQYNKLKVLDETIKFAPKNSIFDYVGIDCFIELKSRNNNYKQYPTTMVGYNKIKYCLENPSKTFYFCFGFLDGLCYYKFDEEDLNNGVIEIKTGGRSDRGIDESKQYAFINIRKLIKID